MTAPGKDDLDDEAPLDPAMARVQAKLRRLMLVSGITLGVGFVAVLFAVIWRVNNPRGAVPDGEAWTSSLEIPAGATVVATDLDGDRLAVTVDAAEGRQIHVFHLPSGRRLGTATLLTR
ncbi:DUF6476 family protein [Chthonobacter albigriseus]|uniref:DUF6476 family protein n=1 Tax=Chthonobacter albigriseus TaxID=1683161 RepID=UPI0015EF0001|nr:DUF6476 family protein [Chthonobacter albigriseus]